MTSKTFSLIPSLDVTSLDEAARLVEAVQAHPFVYGFKVGFSLGLAQGLPRTVEAIRGLTAKPVIYDHQKAATDIPATGALFARVLADAGIDEVILFPQAGPATLEAWAEAMMAKGLKTIVGVVMTHAKYLQGEGGYLADSSPVDIARRAKAAGVKAFVTPLTKPEAFLSASQSRVPERSSGVPKRPIGVCVRMVLPRAVSEPSGLLAVGARMMSMS